MGDLSRLLRPRSIALIGGWWAEAAARGLVDSGYDGAIWPVSPTRTEMAGRPCFRSLAELPGAPDAAFIGVNRRAAVDIARELSAMGAGGATCFASGFEETDADGAALQRALIAVAGDMPLIGPNCYGFLNYLDRVALWPDVHGGAPVDTGVAIISQSSNIAINLTMQRRGLPLAYLLTAGNQAQTSLGDLGIAVLEDPRVTALGLYIEGIGDIRAFERMCARARDLGKPVVALKGGRSESAQAAALSHTASLAGGAAASEAFLQRSGAAAVRSPEALLEALKLLHFGGPLTGSAVASVSCSGGEAGLMADAGEGVGLTWRPFSSGASAALSELLGPIVTVSNPFDYHTFIWGDTDRMTSVFSQVMGDGFDLTAFVLDMPREDRCDLSVYACAPASIAAAAQQTGARTAVISILPENLSEADCARFSAAGVAPLQGLEAGMAAIDAAARAGDAQRRGSSKPALIGAADTNAPRRVIDEHAAKAALAAYGLPVPRSRRAATAADLAANGMSPPFALKALGVAHKTESGAVALNLPDLTAAQTAAAAMPPADGFLLEEMATAGVAELLVGVSRDSTGLMCLTLGAGGVYAEMLDDVATLVLPVTAADIHAALNSLRIGAVLRGWRGRPAADMEAITAAALSVARYAQDHADVLLELDVNPLIARPNGAVAVDALIILADGDAAQ